MAFYPQVIDPELFARAQRPQRKRGQPSPGEKNLVSGIAISGVDGTPMVFRDSQSWDLKYLVSRHTHMFKPTENSHRIRYDQVQAELLAATQGAIKITKVQSAESHLRDERAHVEELIEKNRKAGERMAEAVIKAPHLQPLIDKLEKLAEESKTLLARREKLALPETRPYGRRCVRLVINTPHSPCSCFQLWPPYPL